MSFTVGDRVSFIHSTEKGKILGFDGDLVVVETDEGFEIPVLAKELVAQERPGTETVEKIDVSKENESSTALADGFYLALSRQDIRFACSFLNKTDKKALLLFQHQQKDELKTIYAGKVEAAEFIRKVNYVDVAEPGTLFLSLILYSENDNESSVHSKEMNLRGKHFSRPVHLKELNDEAYVFLLNDSGSANTEPEKLKEAILTTAPIPRPSEKPKPMPRPGPVVDLHLETLPKAESFKEDPEGGLQYQISVFESEMDRAMAESFEDITFIHGVGNGTLKSELQKRISKNERVDTFKDALREKFGYGALKVIFKS